MLYLWAPCDNWINPWYVFIFNISLHSGDTDQTVSCLPFVMVHLFWHWVMHYVPPNVPTIYRASDPNWSSYHWAVITMIKAMSTTAWAARQYLVSVLLLIRNYFIRSWIKAFGYMYFNSLQTKPRKFLSIKLFSIEKISVWKIGNVQRK